MNLKMRSGYAVLDGNGNFVTVVPDVASAAAVGLEIGAPNVWIEDENRGGAGAGLGDAETLGIAPEQHPNAALRASFLPVIDEGDVANMSLQEAHMRLREFFPKSKRGAATSKYDRTSGMAEALLGQNYKTAKTVKPENVVEYTRIRRELYARYGTTDAKVQGLSLVPHFLMRGSAAGPEFANFDRMTGNTIERLAQIRGVKSSAFTLCKGATPECRASCLVYSGHNNPYNMVIKFARTTALLSEPVAFARMLMESVAIHARRMESQHFAPMFRLNVFSDVPWELVMPWFFSVTHRDVDFGKLQFYDYTKVVGRKLPDNYDITFSYAGPPNAAATRFEYDTNHRRVAVVFLTGADGKPFGVKTARKTPLPPEWCGFRVVDGDISDMRPLDPPGVIVGLRWKIPARQNIDPASLVFAVKIWEACGVLVTTQSARQEPIEDPDVDE
jgi:hypothetical protein